MKIMHFEEIIAWRKQRTLFKYKHGIDLSPSSGYEYVITWDRIKNERDILGWLSHLSEKEWFTPELCADLIEVCARKLSIKYRPLP